MSTRFLARVAVLSALLPIVLAAGKTHIYIDQIPLYTELAPCAQGRLEDIVRNQFSGCGDDQQLTSFACFCISSSTEFSSIISTAVVKQCSREATLTAQTQRVTGSAARNARAIETGGAEARRVLRRQAGVVQTQLASAMEVWESYCAKSTELSGFDSTPSTSRGSAATMSITPGPQTVTAAPAAGAGTVNVPLAAIVVPTVLIPLLAIAGAIAFIWYIRKKAARAQVAELDAGERNRDEKNRNPFIEPIAERSGVEVSGAPVYYEMEHRSFHAELQSGTKDDNARMT